MAKKAVKRKINKKAIIVIILTLYLIIMVFYCAFKLPIKNIVVIGNNKISDSEIIKASGIDDYPRLFKLSCKKISNNIKTINELESVKVSKNLLGQVTIKVSEVNVLFYNALNKTYVLANGKEVDEINNKLGVPILINYVQNDIYENLIRKMGETDIDVVSLISEIEYTPKIKNGITIDPEEFLLRMNDGNHIIISLPNFEAINGYPEMFAMIEEKGVIRGNDAMSFKSFKLIEEEKKKESATDELS